MYIQIPQGQYWQDDSGVWIVLISLVSKKKTTQQKQQKS